MQIGAPIVAMYLLGNPDHYTDHNFCTLAWRSYVFEARQLWLMDTDNQILDKVTIGNKGGVLIAITPVQDYTFRLVEYNHMNLYDWIHLYNKKPKLQTKSKLNPIHIDDDLSCLDDYSDINSDTETMVTNFIVGGGYDHDIEMSNFSDNHDETDMDINSDNKLLIPLSSRTLYNDNRSGKEKYNASISESDTLLDSDSDNEFF